MKFCNCPVSVVGPDVSESVEEWDKYEHCLIVRFLLLVLMCLKMLKNGTTTTWMRCSIFKWVRFGQTDAPNRFFVKGVGHSSIRLSHCLKYVFSYFFNFRLYSG